MLKNPLLEQMREKVSQADKAQIDDAFALADRIAFLLKKHRLSQKDLANKLSKRESEVSKWLSGGHNFTQSTLTKISLAIGESVYHIPSYKTEGTSMAMPQIVLDEHLNIFNVIISRLIKEIKTPSATKFKNYQSEELSGLSVTANGVVSVSSSEKVKNNEFVPANITVEDFKKIESSSLS